ncbi:MAG: class I SAM-dependent methyltransferase [Bacteroidaceae bacterium]|nr:class I SAM-dependent methyltransferase [Bacteroidaceae bacterium]
MEQFLNLDKFTQGEGNSLEQIRSYFRINDWAYRHYHSQDGFMHFRIASNGCFTEEDIYYQPDTVSKFIKPGDVVMELGFGQGANLLYLATCHPDAHFIGVDLGLLKTKDVPRNVTTYQQDYSNLPQFEDNSVDVVYAFETIVHNTDKEKIYREVYRILKPNGVVVVFDYALADRLETYDAVVQKAITVTSKGGAAAMMESLEELNGHYTNCGLKIEKCFDHTRATLPDLKRLERKAAKILTRPMLAKLMFWLLPDQFVSNIVIGYIGYDSANAGIGTYREWVLRKP